MVADIYFCWKSDSAITHIIPKKLDSRFVNAQKYQGMHFIKKPYKTNTYK
jgi:hypothetical protein